MTLSWPFYWNINILRTSISSHSSLYLVNCKIWIYYKSYFLSLRSSCQTSHYHLSFCQYHTPCFWTNSSVKSVSYMLLSKTKPSVSTMLKHSNWKLNFFTQHWHLEEGEKSYVAWCIIAISQATSILKSIRHFLEEFKLS